MTKTSICLKDLIKKGSDDEKTYMDVPIGSSLCYGLVEKSSCTVQGKKDLLDGPFEKSYNKITVQKDGVYNVKYFLEISQKGKTNNHLGIGLTLVGKNSDKERYYLVKIRQ